MLGKTHAAMGVLSSYFLINSNSIKIFLIAGSFALLGSLLPDIDTNKSLIHSFKYISLFTLTALTVIYTTNKIIPILLLLAAIIYAKTTQHRTFTHSILGYIIFSFIIFIAYAPATIYFLVGYGLHLFADSLTIHGIPLFYPYSNKCYGFKLLKTGSSLDRSIGGLCILMFIYSLLA